jgi:hypothetical protein
MFCQYMRMICAMQVQQVAQTSFLALLSEKAASSALHINSVIEKRDVMGFAHTDATSTACS